MESKGKIGILFIWFLNILFVYMGYAGIAKMVRQQAPPFHQHGMAHMIYIFFVIPSKVILFWNSYLGHVAIWSGCILLPILAYILISREKLLTGLFTLIVSVIPFGLVGFLIWFHAFIDLPHDRL